MLSDAVGIKAWGVQHSEGSQHASGESKALLSQSQYMAQLPRLLVFKVLSFLIVLPTLLCHFHPHAEGDVVNKSSCDYAGIALSCCWICS